jgi:hypothetical protein
MAGLCTYFAGRANTSIMEFCCDEESEVQDLPTTTEHGKGVFENYKQCAPMGSTCLVGNDGGELLVYMLFSFGWKKISG